MATLDFLAGPTGGFSYHAAALRYRHSLWQPFLSSVDTWLNEVWKPKSSELLIFGPSAGWTLPARFLSQFEHVICVEPDPLARLIFRYRFRKTRKNSGIKKLSFISRADLLPWFSSKPQMFSEFLEGYPNAAVLFSNLLGQIPLLQPDRKPSRLDDKQDLFIETLGNREWASFHDLLSGPFPVSKTAPPRLSQQTAIAILSDLVPLNVFAEEIFPAGAHLIDHDTLWLSAQGPTECAPWQIRPNVNHFVGFIHSPFA